MPYGLREHTEEVYFETHFVWDGNRVDEQNAETRVGTFARHGANVPHDKGRIVRALGEKVS